MSTKVSPKVKLFILGFVVAVAVGFIFFVKMGSSSTTVSLYITSAIIMLAGCFFTSDTIKLLYQFYEQKAPWQRFIPVINEFYAIDIKFRIVAYIFLFIGIALTILGILPYNIKSIFGATFATEGSYFMLFAAFIVFGIMQIIVGIGTFLAIKDVKSEWLSKIGTDIGMIKLLSAFSILPVLRILSYYSLRKPLDTLVAFNNMTASSSNAINIIAEDDDEYDDDDEYEYDDEEDY